MSATPAPDSSAATTTSAMCTGGTATTTSCGTPSGLGGSPAPRLIAVRRCSGLASLSHTGTSAARAASPIDVPSRPVPMTWTGPTSSGIRGPRGSASGARGFVGRFIGHRPDAGEVRAQRGSAVQVHVGYVGPGKVALHVREHPHDPRHRALDLQLTGAEQRDLTETELPCGVRRELRDEVGGGGEDHRDEVVDLETVGAHHLHHHLGDPVEHLL